MRGLPSTAIPMAIVSRPAIDELNGNRDSVDSVPISFPYSFPKSTETQATAARRHSCAQKLMAPGAKHNM